MPYCPSAAHAMTTGFNVAVGSLICRINSTGVKDNNFRGNFSFINSVMRRVDHFKDRIARFEMERLSLDGDHREFTVMKDHSCQHVRLAEVRRFSTFFAHLAPEPLDVR